MTARVRAPQTATEKGLAAIWKGLLRADEVGLDDNFFELGGHSLLAVELIVATEKRLGARLQGMEILRESLQVLAALVDRRLGRSTQAIAASGVEDADGEPFECFYFGPGRELYGVFHDAGRERADRALLICSPIGQENLSGHFVLRKLARQVASRGVPVLRFDYFGCGNSLGDDVEASLRRWRDDIGEAFRELKRRAPAAQVVVLGMRLGATLAWTLQNELDIERLIVCDPITSGARHLQELQAMHDARVSNLQQLRFGRPPQRRAQGRELVGFSWSHRALEQLQQLAMTAQGTGLPVDWIATAPAAQQRLLFDDIAAQRRGSRFRALDYDCHWTDAGAAGDILPDAGFSQAVIEWLDGGVA